MKPRSSLPAISVIALGGMLAVSAGQAKAADKYANQEVSYAKPASQPSSEQVQSPRDVASGQANAANITFTDIIVSSATAPSTTPPQANLGDTATHEVGHRNARQDIEVENDETHVAIPRTETVGSNETAALGGTGSRGKQDAAGLQRPAGYAIPEKDDEVVLTTVSNPKAGSEGYREGGVNDTTHRSKKPRRNGTRGKRMHKP